MTNEEIKQTINNLQTQYENVHIHRESNCCTFDVWGSTNNVNNTTNEWTKHIIYTNEDVLCIKNVLHGVVMDERDNIYIYNIKVSSVSVRSSDYWEDGMVMEFLHKDDTTTCLEFFN